MSLSAKLRLILASLSLLMTGESSADPIKVFLLGGQSNMVGTGADTSGLPALLQIPQADVHFYYSTSLTTLRPGSGQDFGPEVTFGRTIADALPAENFGLIKYAASGTDLVSAWDKDTGVAYTNFRAKVTDGLAALISAGHTYEIVGMLWTQGERDARIGRTTAQYEADLVEFIADLRTRYGTNLPFFLNRLSVNQTDIPNITPVRTAQENVAAADPKVYLIDADAMTFHDELHFDAAGQIDLGEAFGQAYLNSLAPDETAPEIDTLSPTHTSSGAEPTANLTITFNEDITFGTGNITLRQAGGTLVESFDVASPPTGLTLSDATITIDPSSVLAGSTGHYIEIDATAIDDLAGNSFAGFSGDGTWSFTTSAADITPPSISSLSPTNTEIDVNHDANLIITFSENIVFGTGNITLRQIGGALVESFDVASPPAGLTLSGDTITINPTTAFAPSTGYYVEIDASAIDDQVNNSFVGISGDGTWSFTTVDQQISGASITVTASTYNTGGAGFPPIRTVDESGLSGEEHSTAVGTSWMTPNADPSGEWIQWDLGNSYTLGSIHVWNTNNNGNNGLSTKSVDIYFSNVADPGDPEGAGTANWTKLGGASVQLPQAPATGTPNNGFNLATTTSTTLPDTPVRYVRFEINSNWLENNSYTALSEIRFLVGSTGPDTTPPSISTFSPANEAPAADPSSNLIITFNEALAFGTGNITLRQSGGALVESFDVASPPASLTLSGASITINPSADLAASTGYYVEIDATAIDDLAGNSYAGISGDGTWSFTTAASDNTPPSIDTLSPANTTTDVDLTSNLIITFTEDIAFGTGDITLRLSGGALVQSFDVASPPAGLTFSNASITINPTTDLAASTGYYVEIDATAIDDLNGNSFAGFSGDGTWSFTTAAPPESPGGLIDGSGITATALNEFNPSATQSEKTIDGSGLNTNFAPAQHSTANQSGWFSENTEGTAVDQWIQWDLGQAYTLDSIRVWNWNQSGNYPNNGIQQVDIYVSSAASPGDPEGAGSANWTLWAENATLSIAPGADGYEGFDLETQVGTTLPTTAIRWIRFEIDTSFGGTGSAQPHSVGLSEIQFFAGSPTPTFSTWIDGFGLDPEDQDFNDDPDGDGLKNGLEAFFGTHPGTANAGLSLTSVEASTITLQHPNPDDALDGLIATYKWSSDLSTWYASDGVDSDGDTTLTAVAIADSPEDNTTTVSATIGGTVPEKLFLQVEVNAP